MCAARSVVDALARGGIERSRDSGGGIGAHVLVGPIAGRRRDEQRDGVGVADDDGVPIDAASSPARDHADARFEPQRAGHGPTVGGGARAIAVDAAHDEIAVRSGFDGRALRRLHPRLERDLSRTAGGQPHDDDLVGCAGEHLARERHAAGGEGHVSRCRRQIQIAPVVLDRIDLGETSTRDRQPSGRASARAASTSPSRRRACAASVYLLSASRRRTSGSASFASGLTGSYGRPAHSVSSFSCSRSWTMPPNTMAPSRPLPTGRARTHSAVPAWRLSRGASSRQQGMIGGRCAIPEAERRRGRRRFAGQPRRGRRLRRGDDDARGNRSTETGACERPAQPAPGTHFPLFRTSTTASNAALGLRSRSQSSG